MKKLTIMRKFLILAIGLLGYISVNAQTSLSVNSETLYQNGYNSSNTTATTASEATDSVTVGSVMRYYVTPDADLNASYSGILTGTLSSSFTWALASASGVTATFSTVGSYTAFTNYQEVTWKTTGTANLTVQETSASAASCPGSTTTIPVAVIAVPTATFGTDPSAVCATTPVQTFSLPLTLTTAVKDGWVRINYTVYDPKGAVFTAAQDLDIKTSTTSFSVTLTGATLYGDYYVVINSITDRISRKGVTDVTGTISDSRIDMYVYKTPVTGPIYHIPNK
jgi:hypothetical protein